MIVLDRTRLNGRLHFYYLKLYFYLYVLYLFISIKFNKDSKYGVVPALSHFLPTARRNPLSQKEELLSAERFFLDTARSGYL